MVSNFFDSGIDKDGLFAKLDRAFYRVHPDLWEGGDYFISHPDYTAIISHKKKSFFRKRTGEEQEVTSNYIKVDGYHLWKVGRVYTVKHHGSPMRGTKMKSQEGSRDGTSEEHAVTISQDGIIGKLRLKHINPNKKK